MVYLFFPDTDVNTVLITSLPDSSFYVFETGMKEQLQKQKMQHCKGSTV